MMKLAESWCPSCRALAVVTALAMGTVACTDAQSREAPEDEGMPAAAAPAADEAPTDRGPAARASQPSDMTVPVGAAMTFRVDEDVSTDTHSAGDRFVATLSSPVMSADGRTALEDGTPSQWVVTESTTEDGQALLAVELESIEVDGEWTPVAATVTQTSLQADDPDSGGETAAKIGVGTAAGALIGQILGKDTESTLKGAGVGAAVGTAVALATRGGSAKIPAGSTLTVQLQDPLSVS